ncbi:MAG: transporter, partial [Bacteroidota bacterium]
FNKENSFERNYDLIHPTALLKYGLKKIEFRLETTVHSSYEHLIPNPRWIKGLDPIVIGFKTQLWEEKKLLPKTSFIFHVGLPSIASKVFRADHLAPAFRFTMQNSLTKNIALGYNIGAEWDGFSSTPVWIYTFAPGFELGEKWYAYIEAFGFIQKNEKPQHSLDGGIAYYISNDVKIDLSGGFGISEEAPKNYVAVGISFRFH